MRHIKKATLDEMLRLVRKRKVTHDNDLMQAQFRIADELATQAFGIDFGVKWLAFSDVVGGVLSLNQNTSNDAIYAIFQLIGIEASTPVEAGAQVEESKCAI
jgi:hypothetical protein